MNINKKKKINLSIYLSIEFLCKYSIKIKEIPGVEELRPGGGLLRDLEDCKPPHDSVVKSGLQLVLPGFMLELELYKGKMRMRPKEKGGD